MNTLIQLIDPSSYGLNRTACALLATMFVVGFVICSKLMAIINATSPTFG